MTDSCARGAMLAWLLCAPHVALHAQRADAAAAGVVHAEGRAHAATVDQRGLVRTEERAGPGAAKGGTLAMLDRLPAWSAPVASLVLPGVGQARLRQGRAVAFLAVEGFLLLQYGKDLSEGRRNERDYREIARTIARRGFAAAPPDTVWQYYEKLSEYVESGAFTMASSGPTVPETDSTTYNGFQWWLARQQYCVDAPFGSLCTPQYERALALYESRAMRQPYRWSWRNAQLEKDLYVRTISRTNDAYRRATFDLSAVIANHLLSAIDAFVVVRLTQQSNGAMGVSASVPIR